MKKSDAEHNFSRELARWAEWFAEKQGAPKPVRRSHSKLTVAALFSAFIASKKGERSRFTIAHLNHSLRAFVAVYGGELAECIRPAVVQAWKADMVQDDYSPKTVNHCIAAIKAMFRWGAEMELIPAVALTAIKPIRLARPEPQRYSVQQFADLLTITRDSQVAAWALLQWLTMARPAEMPRLVGRQGVFSKPWIFVPKQAKTAGRQLVLSEAALKVLALCEPRWTTHFGYRKAMWTETDRAYCPHPLRHGAASYLHSRGVAREMCDLALGHVLPRVSETYVPRNTSVLRETMSILGEAASCLVH